MKVNHGEAFVAECKHPVLSLRSVRIAGKTYAQCDCGQLLELDSLKPIEVKVVGRS